MERALRAHLPEGSFEDTPPQRSKAMQSVRGKENRTTEQCLRLGLVRAGVRGWTVRPSGYAGSPDFFFAARRLAVFVDGCFWHGCPRCGHLPRTNGEFCKAKIERNRKRDKRTYVQLKKQGIDVVRFWEHELQNELAKCVARIRVTSGKGLRSLFP